LYLKIRDPKRIVIFLKCKGVLMILNLSLLTGNNLYKHFKKYFTNKISLEFNII